MLQADCIDELTTFKGQIFKLVRLNLIKKWSQVDRLPFSDFNFWHSEVIPFFVFERITTFMIPKLFRLDGPKIKKKLFRMV